VVEILQHLPQCLNPSAVAANHSGTVTNRIGHCARQHRRIIKVPFPVTRVL
jgi:hypothetical protein